MTAPEPALDLTVRSPVHINFVDKETGGLDYFVNETWETGVIVRGHANPVLDGRWAWQLEIDEDRVDPEAAKICRFEERYIARGRGAVLTHHPDFGECDITWRPDHVASTLVELFTGAHWVGCVPNFDVNFMIPFLRRHGHLAGWPRTPWYYHLGDVENMAAGRLRLPPPWDSDDLSRRLGVPPVPEHLRHTALGDAAWAEQMYDAIMTGPDPVPTTASKRCGCHG